MQLSTEVNNHVIIFHDGSKLFITQKQSDAIFQQSSTVIKSIRINNNFYTFSSMAKILSLEDYYREYPEEIPVSTPEWKYDDNDTPLTEDQIKIIRRGVMQGLKSFIDEELAVNRKPLNALALYNTKLTNLKDIYSGAQAVVKSV